MKQYDIKIKIWIDDIRKAPSDEYFSFKTTNETIEFLKNIIKLRKSTPFINISFLIDIDHDAGEFRFEGGDYIKILDWMEENNISCTLHVHSMNPVGRENMYRIAERNKWDIDKNIS